MFLKFNCVIKNIYWFIFTVEFRLNLSSIIVYYYLFLWNIYAYSGVHFYVCVYYLNKDITNDGLWFEIGSNFLYSV